MVASLSREQTSRCLSRLREWLDSQCRDVIYLNLGDLKTVRVMCCHPEAATMVRRQLAWSVTNPVKSPEATLYFWAETDSFDFHKRILGLDFERDEEDTYLLLVTRDEGKMMPFAEFSDYGAIMIWGTDTNYYSIPSMDPESLLKEGHLFSKLFYRIIDTPISSMIHGACVGVEGNGILLCARGYKGKSTLTVTAMLRGFDFVADDYLLLEKNGETLEASPIYSTVSLSPRMYNILYDDLDRAHFVCHSALKDKYVLDVSAYICSLRRHLPVRACFFPEIVSDTEPSVVECTPQERGRAVTHMIHSTIGQMNDQGNANAVLKLVDMIRDLPFYRIKLCSDIFNNVECLRKFVKQLYA